MIVPFAFHAYGPLPRFVMVALVVIIVSPGLFAENHLDEIRRKVRKDTPSAVESDPVEQATECMHCQRRSCCCDDDDGFFAVFFGDLAEEAILFTVASPVWIPHRLLADDLQNTAEFPTYPYTQETAGSLVIGNFESTETSPWMGQFTADAGSDFSDIDRFGGRLQFDTPSRFGIDTEFNVLNEGFGGARDSLWLGDLNLTYRFAQSETWQFRAGLGANWMADDDDVNSGFNFTYNVDVYPVRHWVIKTGIDYGTLGHTNRFHYRGTFGIQLNEIEIFTGYDYLHVAGQDIHMMISGLTIWFD